MRTFPGRCSWLQREEGGELVVHKQYRREGLFAGLGKSPARREFEILREWSRLGLPVPEPIDVFESKQGSEVRMAFVPHECHLAEVSVEACRGRLKEVLDIVVRLHEAGWYHRDLYLNHFLLSEGGGLVLIDVGRARHAKSPRKRWFVKDLAALLHQMSAELRQTDAVPFLRAYLAGRSIPAGQFESWIRAVERKEARMSAHQPRYGETFPLPPLSPES